MTRHLSILFYISCLAALVTCRNLADNNNNNNNAAAVDDQVPVYSEYAFLSKFALKFVGCYTVPQFYAYGQGQNQKNYNQQKLGIYPQQVVKYKLCAGDAKSLRSSCVGAEYVTDLSSFVNAYTEAKMTQESYTCEKVREEADSTGGCATADDMTTCEEAYYNKTGFSSCIRTNIDVNFDVQRYMYCQQYKINNVAYYIGPICKSDGSGIVLNVFTDRYCTAVDTSGAFFAVNGYNVPYSVHSNKNLATQDFYSCVDQHYYTLNNMCTSLYPLSAKCETGMKGVIASPTTSGCNYINSVESIQIQPMPYRTGNGAATAFAWIFFLSSIGLGYYCYKLRSKKPIASFYEDVHEGTFS